MAKTIKRTTKPNNDPSKSGKESEKGRGNKYCPENNLSYHNLKKL